jgi:hypothetical protein
MDTSVSRPRSQVVMESVSEERSGNELKSPSITSDVDSRYKTADTVHTPGSSKYEGESALRSYETPQTPIADRYSVPNYIVDKNRIIDDQIILKRNMKSNSD